MIILLTSAAPTKDSSSDGISVPTSSSLVRADRLVISYSKCSVHVARLYASSCSILQELKRRGSRPIWATQNGPRWNHDKFGISTCMTATSAFSIGVNPVC